MQKVQQHKICNTLPHEMQKVQCTKAISVTSYLTWGYVPYYMLCIKLNLQFSAKQCKKMPSQDALYTRMNCNTETYSPMHQFALLMQFHRPKKCAGLDIFKSIFFFKKISLCITLLPITTSIIICIALQCNMFGLITHHSCD